MRHAHVGGEALLITSDDWLQAYYKKSCVKIVVSIMLFRMYRMCITYRICSFSL